jgi:hypothetical protein
VKVTPASSNENSSKEERGMVELLDSGMDREKRWIITSRLWYTAVVHIEKGEMLCQQRDTLMGAIGMRNPKLFSAQEWMLSRKQAQS